MWKLQPVADASVSDPSHDPLMRATDHTESDQSLVM